MHDAVTHNRSAVGAPTVRPVVRLTVRTVVFSVRREVRVSVLGPGAAVTSARTRVRRATKLRTAPLDTAPGLSTTRR